MPNASFEKDPAKLIDMIDLTKDEFLDSYSYLNEESYILTRDKIIDIVLGVSDFDSYFKKNYYTLLEDYKFDVHEMLKSNNFDEDASKIITFDDFCHSCYEQFISNLIK